MKRLMTFYINGELVEVAASGCSTLLDVLREDIGITSVKKGCDEGDCGACTVLLDGQAIASCSTMAVEAEGRHITTIEGVSAGNGDLHPVQQAFIDNFAIQCGFCTPGMILATIALLNENPDPTEEEIRDFLRGNICRCTGYKKIVEAVLDASERIKKGTK